MISGEKILYNGIFGTIDSIIDNDTATVKLEDGKVYALKISMLIPIANSSFNYAAKELKNIDILKSFAQALKEAGVSSLAIKDGVIEEININETLEEKKVRYVKKAVKDAEVKALKEFEKENKKNVKK